MQRIHPYKKLHQYGFFEEKKTIQKFTKKIYLDPKNFFEMLKDFFLYETFQKK